MLTFESYSESKVHIINRYLDATIQRHRSSVSQRFSPLLDAMEYSLQGAGKRFRPLVVLAGAKYCGLNDEKVLPAAAAVEFIHTYSLIHDDLPALDDDDERRGKPSSHKKFGEATAILAGDALATEAFGELVLLRDQEVDPDRVLDAIQSLTHFAGVGGMVGGQLLDVTTEPHEFSLPEVEFIHIHKTGALILASVMMGARISGLAGQREANLKRFGEALGLAFQISDDLLDSDSSLRYSRGPSTKPKPSYRDVMTPTEMKSQLDALVETAVDAIKGEGETAEPLVAIAEFVRRRKN